MHKLYGIALFVGISVTSIFSAPILYAVSDSLVISQVQLGDIISARNELVEIYNNSSEDVEVTNWCINYLSSGYTQKKLSCFIPGTSATHIYLPSHSAALAISNELSVLLPPIGSDLRFSSTLSNMGGYVRIVDNFGVEIDKVGWGMPNSENNLIVSPPVGEVLGRKVSADENVLRDTDVNYDDFEAVEPRSYYNYGSLYELQDICANIDGVQSELPEGYDVDNIGNCSLPPPEIDVCSNIVGLQSIIPNDMEVDNVGNCVQHDECPNLSDAQMIIPDEMIHDTGGNCVPKPLSLQITELLPNPSGDDNGEEFIELYNPNDKDVSLDNYVIFVGSDYKNSYNFPSGAHINPGQYAAFYDDDIKFTLVNTSSGVKLQSIDGSFVFEVPIYDNPKDNIAWALIDNKWQYTNRPTPGLSNLPSLIEETPVEADTIDADNNDLEPCAANQYRNPLTNRCKLIEAAGPSLVLAPCKEGEERNPETNRCRKITSTVSTLAPCPEGQERNPLTNRCRSIATVLSANTLAPCKEGQERNPETNRCRKVTVASTITKAKYAPESTAQSPSNYLIWWSLAGIGSLAVGYGVWEWRQELTRLGRKLLSLFGFRDN
jgi:hypothetical protein